MIEVAIIIIIAFKLKSMVIVSLFPLHKLCSQERELLTVHFAVFDVL